MQETITQPPQQNVNEKALLQDMICGILTTKNYNKWAYIIDKMWSPLTFQLYLLNAVEVKQPNYGQYFQCSAVNLDPKVRMEVQV